MARIRKTEETVKLAGSKRIVWLIAVYIRLSKEDGYDESLSVTNQKKIINEYLEQYFESEFVVVDYYIDDGLTGTDYERPDFQRMIRDMETGKINCIICKNLSRMFRNYSDQGYFLEKIFPTHKTRFVTVSDPKVDSFLHPETIQGLEVPINGLMNDRFAAKTSHDVRATLAMKRRKGEYIGSFAPYGYLKNPENKNSLIIDEEAAQVVRDIFNWFVIEGMSKVGIAKRLNDAGFLNPTAYKRSLGFKYSNPHTHQNDGFWNPTTIMRLLKNQMYIGTMVQGRQMVVSYKVHNTVSVPEDEWYVVENTHEAIIDAELFAKAQELQKRDTRTAPGKSEVHLLAGFVRCQDCKKAMSRHRARNIYYFYCKTFRFKSTNLCTKHSIREDKLLQVVLIAIQKQIELVATISETITEIMKAPIVQNQSTRLISTIKQRKNELEKVTSIIDGLYGDWKNGDISKDEYHRMKRKYEVQAEQLRQVIKNFEDECNIMVQGFTNDDPYLTAFLKHQNITSLERSILVDLVQNIYVHQGGAVEIEFKFADQHRRILEYIENNRESLVLQGIKAI